MTDPLHLPKRSASIGSVALGAALIVSAGIAPAAPTGPGALRAISSSDLVTNGVTQNASGRLFMPVRPRHPGEPYLIEVVDGRPAPFPDAEWNAPGAPDGHFVGVNAIRVGPDGALWVVDSGSLGIDKPSVSGAAWLNGGRDAVRPPVVVYAHPIGGKAVPQ